jgi:hypothetical protein
MANLRGGGLRSADVRKKLILGGSALVLLTIVGMALYTFVALSWTYSEGDRSGILQKFSRKGWICKTYEGELALSYTPGLAPVIWTFSVRDDAVANKVKDAEGKRVVLHYREHRGVPSECFGETQYFVDDVRLVNDLSPPPHPQQGQ